MSAIHPSSAFPTEDELVVRPLGDTVFEVTVLRKNRAAFFHEALQRLRDTREEAEITLKNLQTWLPEVAGSFRIRDPESVLSTPFRLMCESDVGHVPFDDEKILRQYLAVSYCWRRDDSDWPVLLPRSPWPFSKAFVDAVLAERGVYLDALEPDANFRREGIWIN